MQLDNITMGLYDAQDESVYNLIPRTQVPPERPARHVSGVSVLSASLILARDFVFIRRCVLQFPSKVHPKDMEFGQGSLKGHANFGLPNGTNANATTRFLKSHEKAPVLPERETHNMLSERSVPGVNAF